MRSISDAPAVAGWVILQARRHVGDPADLNATEAATFGPTLHRLEGAPRSRVRALPAAKSLLSIRPLRRLPASNVGAALTAR